MTTELARGQNLPMPAGAAAVELTMHCPVALVVALLGADERIPGPDAVLETGAARSGVTVRQTSVTADLAALPADVDRVVVTASLEGGRAGRFGAIAPPVADVSAGGAPLGRFTITDLTTERALQIVEFYRRQGTWKIRALGQGYDGGLEVWLREIGVEERAPVVDRVRALLGGPAPSPATAPAGAPASPRSSSPVASPTAPPTAPPVARSSVPGTPNLPPGAIEPMPWGAPPADPQALREEQARAARRATEKLYEQVWGVFEDAARSAAAFRSAVEFADRRLEQDLESVLADPSARTSPAGLAAQEQARARRAELVDRARANLDRDTAQLVGEVEQLEPALPPEMARWDSPAWAAWQAREDTAVAVRLGDLHLPERPELRVPMVMRLPIERALWIDAGTPGLDGAGAAAGPRLRARAGELAVTVAARMLAAFPVGDLKLHVMDPEGKGAGAGAFAPLAASGLFAGPAATTAPEIAALLARLVDRVELVRMAVDSGAVDSLPPHVDVARQLLLVHDFPFGFDDRAVNQLRHIVDEGPRVGVHVVVVADRGDAGAFGPLLDPLWRSMLRLTPIPEDHIGDPWVGLPWVYTPDLPDGGDGLTRALLTWVASSAGRGA